MRRGNNLLSGPGMQLTTRNLHSCGDAMTKSCSHSTLRPPDQDLSASGALRRACASRKDLSVSGALRRACASPMDLSVSGALRRACASP